MSYERASKIEKDQKLNYFHILTYLRHLKDKIFARVNFTTRKGKEEEEGAFCDSFLISCVRMTCSLKYEKT